MAMLEELFPEKLELAAELPPDDPPSLARL